jgi:hypothetical protein
MSTYRNAGWSAQYGGTACRGRWSPVEIAAMVVGFMIFWPIGLAILLAKVWQKSNGAEGDVFSFVRERAQEAKRNVFADCETARAGAFWGSSGNVAFDEWRESELRRLEEERRKLLDAEREFSDHISELRRARDRDEFESFMRARKSGQA